MSEFVNSIDLLGDEIVMSKIIDGTITEFNDNTLTSLYSYAFYKCINLKTVDLPNVTNFGTNVFEYCSMLETVNLPLLTLVAGSSFMYCTALKSIKFRSATKITYGFWECSALTTVDFDVVTDIGTNSFYNCPNLTSLILRTPTMCRMSASGVLNGTKIASGTGYIYVPRSFLSDTDSTMDYRRATNWSTYANQFRALEDYTVDGTIAGALDESKI